MDRDDGKSDPEQLTRALLIQSPIARAYYDALVMKAADYDELNDDAKRELIRLRGECDYEKWRSERLCKRLTGALAEYERGWPSAEVAEGA